MAHGFIAGLLTLLSWPECNSGACEPLSGALAALRGFRRRWAESESGREVALGMPSVHSVTSSCGSFSLVDHEASATSLLSAFEQVSTGVGPSLDLGQSLLPRPPVHGREWAPHRVDGRGQMMVEPRLRPTLEYRPLRAPSFASRFSPLARVEHSLQPPVYRGTASYSSGPRFRIALHTAPVVRAPAICRVPSSSWRRA